MAEQTGAPLPILFAHFGDNWIRGSERCLLDLIANIDRSRFAPVVWCNAEALRDAVRPLAVDVHLQPFRILFDWQKPRFDVMAYRAQVREATRLIRQYDFRILHGNGAAPVQWLFPAARRARLPLAAHLHIPYGRRERFTFGIHQATVAVGVSKGCINGLLSDGYPSARSRVIYNAVDTTPWERVDYTGLRASLGIDSNAVVLTAIGSLIRRKGQDLLIRAVAKLKDASRPIHLLLVGDGPDREKLALLAGELSVADRVHITGFLPSAGAVFRDATDIAVSASWFEGFGLTIIEAGAASLPIVATKCVGVSEILVDQENGLLVPTGDVDALAHAILLLVESPDRRARLALKMRRTVEERFMVSRYVAEFENLYSELALLPRERLGWFASRWRGETAMYRRWVSEVAARKLLRRPPRQEHFEAGAAE